MRAIAKTKTRAISLDGTAFLSRHVGLCPVSQLVRARDEPLTFVEETRDTSPREARVRYLYGDSSPFPYGYDFLATLESFMTTASRVVQLATNARKVEAAADQALVERMKGLEEIEQFHLSTVEALQEAARDLMNPLVREYAGRVIESAVRVLAEHKARVQDANEREQQGAGIVAATARTEIEQHLDAFLRTVRLPTDRTRVRVSIATGKTEARCTLTHPHALMSEYEIDPSTTAWSKPRKLSEFIQGVNLLVGAKKAWFSNQVTPEREKLDDFFIGEVDMMDDQCMLLVRKKPDQPDSFIFTARRGNGMLDVRVDRPGMAEANTLSDQLDQGDLPVFDRLLTALQTSTTKLPALRSRLRSCTVDNVSAFDTEGALRFIDRLVSLFAPTVKEIATRSPNPQELSLKRETDDGKREEIYLRRDDIRQKLEPLPSEGRAVFAPLGLDHWLPSSSMTPPPVSVRPMPPSGYPQAAPPSSGFPQGIPPSGLPAGVPVPPPIATQPGLGTHPTGFVPVPPPSVRPMPASQSGGHPQAPSSVVPPPPSSSRLPPSGGTSS
jgi:hypothetical protein